MTRDLDCDRLLALLPLLALGELDAAAEPAARAHLGDCERCAARLAELQRTRGALDLAAVGAAAPLSGATIRAAGLATIADRGRAAPPGSPAPIVRLLPFLSPRVAAAAAVFIALAAFGFAFGGWRQLSARADRGSREPAISPVALARALAALAERVDALELRHDRDLLVLAQTVDREQSTRDHGIALRFADFEEATRAELIATRSALGDVARLIVPARAEAPLEER